MPTMAFETQDAPSSPLVNSLVETLTERIYAGRFNETEGFPAERELVGEFGISRNVVRRALDILEARNLIVRVPRCRTLVRIPERTGPLTTELISENRADSLPSRPARTRRKNIGFGIWPEPNDPGTSSVIQGIYRALDPDTFRLILGHIYWDSWGTTEQSERRFLELMADDQDIAGILLTHQGQSENLETLQKVRAMGIPLVFLDRLPPESFDGDYVGVTNDFAAEQVVEHLLELGHRRIAHISNMDPASTVSQRKEGYYRALRSAGVPVRPEFIVTATESSATDVPRVYGEMVQQLFSLPELPTAVFAVNDVIADRFVHAVRATGKRVPEDIAVAGFDGRERWSHHPPFLTTAYQPFEQIGEMAARLLMERIEKATSTPYRHILLSAPLHIYGSTVRQK